MQNQLEYPINVLNPRCPSRHTLEILSDKWVMVIVMVLAKGSMRNGQLKRKIGNISQKMLIQTLRKLEESGLVDRIVHEQVPPNVEYRLTALGHTLVTPIRALGDWAETHYAEVLAAQGWEPRED